MTPLKEDRVEIASRKKWLPVFPELEGYKVVDTRVPHPSPEFRGFYIWSRKYYPIHLSTLLQMVYGEGVRKALLEPSPLSLLVQDNWTSHISINFNWRPSK